MRIDPKALRLFLAVCKEGTISGAARTEHLSQPSVSVAISQLERVLKVKLFDRFRQGIQLTPAGEALKIRAQAIDNLLESAQHEIKLLEQNITGPLVIAGTPGALSTVVSKVIHSFSALHPRFELRVLERPEQVLHQQLKNYDIDLAIVTSGMTETPDEMEELAVVSDPFFIIVGGANQHLPDEMSLPELAEARWILPEAVGGFRRQVDALFISSQSPMPRNVIRCDSLLTTKSVVRNTDYMTILPREVVYPEVSSGQLREIKIKGISFQREVGFLWLKERKLSALAQSFIEHSRETLIV